MEIEVLAFIHLSHVSQMFLFIPGGSVRGTAKALEVAWRALSCGQEQGLLPCSFSKQCPSLLGALTVA